VLFADDIVLVDVTKERISFRIGSWREALESKRCRTSRRNKIYKCDFNKVVRKK